MEDLDTARVLPGCADEILRTLEYFGLCWDGTVAYQSASLETYEGALQRLRARGFTFECSCRRRLRIESDERGYPGTCRAVPARAPPTATRFRIDEADVMILEDRFQGPCRIELRSMGDVVVRRRDGVIAYQLAVVVDDARQGITDVVRGADLLTSTAWQVALQRALELPTPRYAHVPVIVEPGGGKLAKSRRSVALTTARVGQLLTQAFRLLQHVPPAGLEFEAPSVILNWGIASWNPQRFHAHRQAKAPPA